jgi:hypothetical protein
MTISMISFRFAVTPDVATDARVRNLDILQGTVIFVKGLYFDERCSVGGN